ncbi:MAG TPA: WG repeat-containing protein, partial [Oscillospiraceae bacterium]|nr:WG repeat-containing protein [Oscillospiraceae bacterium]
DYTDGYFDGKLYAEAGVAFSSDMYLGAAFGLIAKDYSLGRTEIKIWSYTEEYNAETQGELQSIKFPENIINMETGDSKKLRIIGVYKNRVTENIFEAPIDSGVEYILNPSNSASIDNAGNIKILTDENREIEVTARYKGKEGKMVVYVEEKNTGNEENDFNGFNIIWLEGYYDILDSLGDFSEGLARITKTEDGEYKSGYVNKTGKIVVPLIYDRAENFSEGLAVVVKDGKLGFIDKDGREVIPLNYYPYYYAYGFSEGLSVIFIDNKYGYINKSNEIIIPPIYEYAGKFSEGLAVVRENGKCGYIDKNGEVVIPFIYNLGNDFSEGLAAVRGDGGWGYIDKKGNVIIPFKYFSAMDFSEGLALVSKRAQYEHGYIDKTGKEVIPFVYTAYSRSFSEGLAAVTKNSLFPIYDYIDKNGNIIISSTYEDLNHAPYVGDFHEGLAVVRKRNDTVIVDKSGNEIASFDNMIVFGFNEGVASVQFFEGGYGRMKLGIMANPLTR